MPLQVEPQEIGPQASTHAGWFDRWLLVSFGVAGTLWVLGLTAVLFLYNQEYVPLTAAYVAVFTSAIALRRLPTGVALLAAWAVAVLAMAVLTTDSEALIGETILLGGIQGTFFFCLWVFSSGLLLLCIDPDRR